MKIGQHLKNRVRYFNNHILNRVMRKLAFMPFGLFALVRHVGRRSGKQYETPIIIVPTDSGFVIALTYGPEVDWYQNVLAAGGCEVVWHGKDYVINEIVPMDGAAALPLFPQPERTILRFVGIRHYLTMRYQTAGQTLTTASA